MADKVEIEIDTTGAAQAKQDLESVEAAGKKTAKGVSEIGEVARGILASDLITQIGESAKNSFTNATTAASDLGESVNAVNRIFGTSADEIEEWGETQANAYGLSQRAFNQMAVPIGASLKNVGLDLDTVAKKTIELTERAADMGSVFNQDVATVLEDIQAGLRGEADPLEKYGVGLSAAAVEQQALADTGKKVAAELTTEDIMLARVNLLLKQTASTTGDFKDTADGYANAQRIANAQIEEAQAVIGQHLLPVLAGAAKLTANVAEVFSMLPGPIQAVTAGGLALGAAFLFLGPKVVAALDAFKELRGSLPDVDSKMGKFGRSAARTATTLGAIIVASQTLGAIIGSRLNPQVDELAHNIAEWGAEGIKSGEAARLLGNDFQQLDYAIRAVADQGKWKDISRGTADVIEGVTGLGNVVDDSFTKARERMNALDGALAQLVSSGDIEGAELAFRRLAEVAAKNGVTAEELIAALPQYAAAQAKAGRETMGTKVAIEGQVIALKDLHDALRKQSDPTFALIEAQGDLAEAQKEYNEAIKEHGKTSPEAQEALRNMARAAIELSGAVVDAQGSFNGKLTPAMRATLSAAGLTENQIKQLEQQFINATVAGNAFAKNYTATVTTVFKHIGQPTTGDFSGLGGRQSGGLASGWIIAGEHGQPEAINVGPSARVFNSAETEGLFNEMNTGMGPFSPQPMPVDVNVHLILSGAEREFVTFFKKVIDVEADGDVTRLSRG